MTTVGSHHKQGLIAVDTCRRLRRKVMAELIRPGLKLVGIFDLQMARFILNVSKHILSQIHLLVNDSPYCLIFQVDICAQLENETRAQFEPTTPPSRMKGEHVAKQVASPHPHSPQIPVMRVEGNMSGMMRGPRGVCMYRRQKHILAPAVLGTPTTSRRSCLVLHAAVGETVTRAAEVGAPAAEGSGALLAGAAAHGAVHHDSTA